MRGTWLLVLAGLSTMVASCSLTGLDHFRVQPCGQCDVLNRRDGLDPNGCRVWQCDPSDQFCELGARDLDHDGHPPIACGGSDCDDDDRDTSVGATEVCDGADNDCNGLIDDVHADAIASTDAIVLGGAPAPSFVTYADASDGVVVSWRSGGTTQLGLVDHVDTPSTSAMVVGSTNTSSTAALSSAAASAGCPAGAFTSLAPASCEGGAACPGTQRCVLAPDGAHECEAPVTNNTPLHAMECLTHAECQDGMACNGREVCDPTSSPPLVDARGCRPATGSPCSGGTTCDEELDACVLPAITPCAFADLALAPVSDAEWLGAAIGTEGCASGRVRLGTIDAASSNPALLLWGDGRLSTTWLGVDLDSTTSCTGRSRAAGSQAGAVGASIAGLGIDPRHGRPIPQALAAWRASPVCELGASCAAQAHAPIEVLGLWRERGSAGGAPIRWVNGSDDGRPVRLADESASLRVGVTSWSLPSGAAGYAVAYARAGGGVALALVDAPSAPLAPACVDPAPPVCLSADAGADGVLGTDDDGESSTRIASPGTPRTTPALDMPISEVLDPSAMPLGDVSVTTGRTSATTTLVPLALAWATATEVVVARATFEPSTGALTDGDRMHFPATSPTDVSIVHLAAGIEAADSRAPTRALGGFVVTWATSGGTYALRLADDDGMPIAPGVVRLGEAAEHPRAFLDTLPSSGSTPAGVRARVIAHRGSDFVAFSTICGGS